MKIPAEAPEGSVRFRRFRCRYLVRFQRVPVQILSLPLVRFQRVPVQILSL